MSYDNWGTNDDQKHYSDVIMSALASQITGVSIVHSRANQRTDQSPASLAFMRGIRRWPMNSPHKRQVTSNAATFPFDNVIMVGSMYTGSALQKLKATGISTYGRRVFLCADVTLKILTDTLCFLTCNPLKCPTWFNVQNHSGMN